MSDTVIDLSIIIPAYHEADRIGGTLHTIAQFLSAHDLGQVEVLVLAQTDDDTAAAANHEATSHHFRIVYLGKRAGKGGAVRAGMFEARGRYRMFMDADLATPLTHLIDVKRLMDQNSKVIIAVRDIGSTHKGLRKLISEFGNILVQVLLLPGIKDSQCGFKCFEANAAELIFSRQKILGWGFDMEILKIARILGYKIDTFKANDWKDPKMVGLSGDSSIKTALQVFRDLLKIRLNALLGRYRNASYQHRSIS